MRTRLLGLGFVLLFPVMAWAGTILQPASASSTMGSFSAQYLPAFAIDQSGLSAGYTSGVTDFDSFVAGTVTVGGGSGLNTWYSAQGSLTGTFDFDLGSVVNIESFALWADPQNAGQGVKGFSLFADVNPGFSSPTLLGSFSAVDGLGNANNFAQVFTFSPTAASYVRMQVLSNNGSTFVTGMTEAAFEVSAVPIPPAVWLFGSALGLMGVMRRKVSS